jgi:hypothetical protein
MKVLNSKVLMFVPGFLALLAGCGSGAKDAANKIEAKIEAPELTHTWEADKCSNDVIFGTSKRTQYDFSGNIVKRIEQTFSHENCVDPAGTVVYTGSYKKGDEVQKDVHAIDMTFTSVSVTALNDTGVKLLNTLKLCGKGDWTINVSVDMTAQNRDKLCPVKALPETVFDIYTVEGNKFYWGKGDKKATAADRPSQIDREVQFHQL